MIVARNPIAQKKFSEMFKNRTMKKTYLAIVTTHPDKNGIITDSIGRHPRLRHKMTAKAGLNARESETRYEVLEYFEDTSLAPRILLQEERIKLEFIWPQLVIV